MNTLDHLKLRCGRSMVEPARAYRKLRQKPQPVAAAGCRAVSGNNTSMSLPDPIKLVPVRRPGAVTR
jgi:hypothetical protein